MTNSTSREVWSLLRSQVPQIVTNRKGVAGRDSGLQRTFSAYGRSVRQDTFLFTGINVTGVNSTGTSDIYFDYDSFHETQISAAAHKAQVSDRRINNAFGAGCYGQTYVFKASRCHRLRRQRVQISAVFKSQSGHTVGTRREVLRRPERRAAQSEHCVDLRRASWHA